MSLDASSLLRSLDQACKSLDAARARLVRDVEAAGGNGQRTIQLLERLNRLEKDLETVTEAERRSSEKMMVLERVLLDNRETMMAMTATKATNPPARDDSTLAGAVR